MYMHSLSKGSETITPWTITTWPYDNPNPNPYKYLGGNSPGVLPWNTLRANIIFCHFYDNATLLQVQGSAFNLE